MDQQPLLSIIIPAYNEEQRLPRSLDSIVAFVEDQCAKRGMAIEVIVVENGSRDRTTEIAEAYAQRHAYIQVLHSAKGKGAAVRAGMMAGRGRYLFMCDSDLSMPIEEVLKFLPPSLDGYDVAIASREGPGARRYNEPHLRHVMGRVFNLIVRVIAIPRFQDTQCGFKSFRREVGREVFADGTMDGWAFDVEALFIALHRGYKVVDVPINWYHDPDSRVNPVQDTWRMFRDVLKIRINGWRGVYNRKRAVAG
jgi:dolichyl-phosphate beta-glucosyltransferase